MPDQGEPDEFETEDTEDTPEEESTARRYQVSFYPTDLTLSVYLDKWKRKQLIIPPFQRSYVWDRVRASRLIESFLLGLPVPPVFLLRDRQTNKLQVIDGQQRLLSIVRFLGNEFEDREFALKKVLPQWEGRTIESLLEADQLQVQDSVLRATVIQTTSDDDYVSVFHIFDRLNTGGMTLRPMEIRKALFLGPYFRTLAELNVYEPWREIIGKKNPDKRLRDVEFILRVCSLWKNLDAYEKPMTDFLTECMKLASAAAPQDDSAELEATTKAFHGVCDSIKTALDPKPFHVHGPLNLAVMDAVMGTLLLAQPNTPDRLGQRFGALLADKEFKANTIKSTSDVPVVKARFAAARRHLLGM